MNKYEDPRRAPGDRKFRWGGILENPLASIAVRGLVDGGRVRRLGRALAASAFDTVLEVGCGVGECAALFRQRYVGLDNSLRSVAYAAGRQPQHAFLAGDAAHLPFRDQAFDAALLIDTSHHIPDEFLIVVLRELRRVARRCVIVSDPVLRPGQSRFSRFFYGLDRGACFRSPLQMETLFQAAGGLEIVRTASFRTFPGMYVHTAFVLKPERGREGVNR
jgi:SAM-dependent methyltransferase